MSHPRLRHSILGEVSRSSPEIVPSLQKQQGRVYEVYQTLIAIMDTPFDAFVALLLWFHRESSRRG